MGNKEADIINTIKSLGSTIKGQKVQKKVSVEKFLALLTDIKLVYTA